MTATWVALITHSRIILNRQYVPCSLYQTCLVRDSVRAADNPVSSRSAVRGLPVDLYDGAWLTGLTQQEVDFLEMSLNRFIWMKVATV